ncbi:MAG TPA: MEKHLA domain-containing protein [Novimethylophilus sp.]|jgi:hypothetical protein|uniref:MEKHLA domain-containing protein n=1 Tax=Novimethylophilus sp. TaxID=2137426 RepID=UPI002F3FAE1B
MASVIDLPQHVAILQESYRHWTGRTLLTAEISGEDAVQWLDKTSFAVVSHDIQPDPVFNYANRAALRLFGVTLEQFTEWPSRLSAEPTEQGKRARLMEQVSRDGYIEGYSGTRIAGDGRKFMILNATVWNLLDERGKYYGQAAMIPQWSACV